MCWPFEHTYLWLAGMRTRRPRCDRRCEHAKATSAGSGSSTRSLSRPSRSGDLARYRQVDLRQGTWPLTYRCRTGRAAAWIYLGDEELNSSCREATLVQNVGGPHFGWRSTQPSTSQLHAAKLLEVVGDADDVGRLRRIAHRHRGNLRPNLVGHCHGGSPTRCTSRIKDASPSASAIAFVDGSSVGRKVLALLCFLLTKPAAMPPRATRSWRHCGPSSIPLTR